MGKLPLIRTGKTLGFTEEYCKFNSRLKLYRNACGDYEPAELLVCTRNIFNPDGVELTARVPKEFKLVLPEPPDRAANEARAVRRAKTALFDYIRCNPDLCWFVTLTFDGQLVDRTDYAQIVKLFNTWADNRVRRKGLKYIGVIERHKQSNGLHFHFIMNDVLAKVDSGTVSCKGRKRPIRRETADRYKIPHDDRKIVYNLPEWKYGFSTMIRITDDDGLVKTASYLSKYLTKDFEKIGGRYYYHSNNLYVPKYEYFNSSYKDVEAGYEWEVDEACASFKIIRY